MSGLWRWCLAYQPISSNKPVLLGLYNASEVCEMPLTCYVLSSPMRCAPLPSGSWVLGLY